MFSSPLMGSTSLYAWSLATGFHFFYVRGKCGWSQGKVRLVPGKSVAGPKESLKILDDG